MSRHPPRETITEGGLTSNNLRLQWGPPLPLCSRSLRVEAASYWEPGSGRRTQPSANQCSAALRLSNQREPRDMRAGLDPGRWEAAPRRSLVSSSSPVGDAGAGFPQTLFSFTSCWGRGSKATDIMPPPPLSRTRPDAVLTPIIKRPAKCVVEAALVFRLWQWKAS